MAKEQVDLQMDLDNEPEVEFVFEGEEEAVVASDEVAVEEEVVAAPPVSNEVASLKAEIEAMKASIIQGGSKTPDTQQDLVKALTEALRGNSAVDANAIDLAAINKQYFVDPAKTTDTLIDMKTKKLADLVTKMESRYNRMEQKLKVISDSGTRTVFEKYADEVESLVDRGQSYEDALLMTKAKHLDEFTAEAVEKAMKSAAEKAKPDVPFTNSNMPLTAKGGTKKVISMKEKAIMQKIAENSAGVFSITDDAEFLYNYAKNKGLI